MRSGWKYPKSKKKGKYKSGLEREFASLANQKGLKFEYEAARIPFARPAHYVPDWKIGPNVYIETKGYMAPFMRANLLSFREQHPDIRILLLFGNASNRLNAGSRTTYREWAERHDFECADIRDGLPTHWWKKYASGTK